MLKIKKDEQQAKASQLGIGSSMFLVHFHVGSNYWSFLLLSILMQIITLYMFVLYAFQMDLVSTLLKKLQGQYLESSCL